ncbi:hypothetical protein F2Q69_00005019 [Brassica cretica]|uniref:Uncharacterized protein n=1 Tax=Brassica cretica TaxID=69181 RepID=A0A8S9NYI8_BRACR|nr:hypothetical protein F2Q69_00005019 [Brassica cretica]
MKHLLHKLHIRRNSDVNARIRRPRPNPDYESKAYLFHLELPELAVAGGSVKKLAEIECLPNGFRNRTICLHQMDADGNALSRLSPLLSIV